MQRLKVSFLSTAVVSFLTVLSCCSLLLLSSKQPVYLPAFFTDLYQENRRAIKYDFYPGYFKFCSDHGLDCNDESNQEKYLKLIFYHKLFTGSAAVDCLKGGMLEIPYFWHWVEPNQRHQILDTRTNRLLVEEKPPEEFSKYSSAADIDRAPHLFLADLVTENPGYYHPFCGEFYTFGWCSEREMAFSLLMEIYGYRTKIVLQGIHVTSNIWMEYVDRSGKTTSLIAVVDNTFNEVGWENVNGISPELWRQDLGKTEWEEMYNSNARSELEQNRVKNIVVGPKAAARINKLVKKHL